MSNDQSKQEAGVWAQVEVMGNRTLAGKVFSDDSYGFSMIRLEVPDTGAEIAFTVYLGQGAVFSVTPVDETTARLIAENLKATIVASYLLRGSYPYHGEWDDADDNDSEGIEDDDEFPF